MENRIRTKGERLEKVMEVMKGFRKMKLNIGYSAIDEVQTILKKYLDSEVSLEGEVYLEEFERMIVYKLPVSSDETVMVKIEKKSH
jgi:hypothetical protein